MSGTVDVAGLEPEEWERRLEAAAADPEALASVLSGLDHEIRQEKTWLHDNPSPGPLLRIILGFLGDDEDEDLERLGEQITAELQHERALWERYRPWRPGEDHLERLYPFIKDFHGEIALEEDGLQFPGFTRHGGVAGGPDPEAMALFLSDRFPGRIPASFHVAFHRRDGEIVIKRVFKRELPRVEGITTVGRAVTAELIRRVAPGLERIRELVVDNAANQQTRRLLLRHQPGSGRASFTPAPGADVAATPLGHFMVELARELGLVPGELRMEIRAYGLLRLELDVRGGVA